MTFFPTPHNIRMHPGNKKSCSLWCNWFSFCINRRGCSSEWDFSGSIHCLVSSLLQTYDCRVIYDPRGGNRKCTVQEQAIDLLISLKIPPMNKRETRVNTPPKCSVNCRYAVGTVKIKLISFYLFQLDKMQWIGMASTQREWLSPVWLSKCCRVVPQFTKTWRGFKTWLSHHGAKEFSIIHRIWLWHAVQKTIYKSQS